MFSVYFWHSEGWTARNEALLGPVVKQVQATRHPWVIACDANMWSRRFRKRACGFKKSDGLQKLRSVRVQKRPRDEQVKKKVKTSRVRLKSNFGTNGRKARHETRELIRRVGGGMTTQASVKRTVTMNENTALPVICGTSRR